MERYRRATSRRHKSEEKPDLKTKIVRQSAVCGVIVALVLVIGLFKTDTADAITSRIQNSISYTVDYKETVQKIFSAINRLTKGNEANAVENADKTN